jgi:two-component system OmpR family sensor kinase
MRRIEDEAARMGILVEDLLLLAHVDQTRPMEQEDLDFSALVGDALRDAGVREPDRTLRTNIEQGIRVVGDRDRLLQAVGNLIDNAFVHTPARGPVEVQLANHDEEAVFTVSDRGPGLPPDALGHVFDRFWRGDPSRTRNSGGAGFGLSIVAAVARAHGGSVAAENRPEGGACFTLRVPLKGRGEVTSPP